jgi:hypothetical protein
VPIAATVVGLAACGGPASPSVAKLRTSGGTTRSSATHVQTSGRSPTGDAAQLLVEWAACMRRHGDPNQADPTIDSNKVIHVTFPNSYYSTSGGFGSPCGRYIAAASTALRGGRPLRPPDQAQTLKFAACMRANGISDFPEPTNGGLSINIGEHPDLNPNNPRFQRVSRSCAEKTGVPALGGTPQPGSIEASGGGPPCNNRPASNANATQDPKTGVQAILSSFLEC